MKLELLAMNKDVVLNAKDKMRILSLCYFL